MSNIQDLKKKIENSTTLSSIAIPIAILTFSILIVVGITRMLSEDRSYRDLVHELQSKTFGNKWIAAFELSKFIASNKIPKEDTAWLQNELYSVFNDAPDSRTKNFVVVAIGSYHDPGTFPFLLKAFQDSDPTVKFSAVAALSNLPANNYPWDDLVSKIPSELDDENAQALLLCFAKHHVESSLNFAIKYFSSENPILKNSSIVTLVSLKNEMAIEPARKIFSLDLNNSNKFNLDQIYSFKLNLLQAIEFNQWDALNKEIEIMAADEVDLRLRGKAKNVISLLKK